MNRLSRVAAFALSLSFSVCIAASESPPKPPSPVMLDGESVIVGGWKLPDGHFVPAKMPMRLIYPRPDNETAGWARHRKAYPGLEYRIPIAVQGGAYPFKFEVISAPPGMTIGESVWDHDYGILTWTPDGVSGPHNVTVRITDQELNTVDAFFTVRATTEGFIFLDPSVVTSGDGTINAPLKTFDDVHKGNAEDTTYSGYAIYLRGGQHQLTGWAANNMNYNVVGTNKPIVWLGYPGETVEVDFSQSHVRLTDGINVGDDIFIGGMKIKNSRADMADSRFFFIGGGDGSRATFFEIDFENLVRGTAGNDNPGGVVAFRGSTHREYFTVIGCTIEEYSAPMIGSLYATRYGVMENNTLGPSSANSVNQGLYLKESADYWSLRRNTSVNQNFGYGAIEQMIEGSMGLQRVEIAYNTISTPSITSTAVVYNWASNSVGDHRVWLYRNTIVGKVMGLNGEYTAVFENNIVINNDNPQIADSSGNAVRTKVDNVFATSSQQSQILNNSYQLIGDYRNSFLGRRGHEISH